MRTRTAPLIIAFVAGFLLATVIGMVWVVPFSDENTRRRIGSDVHHPLQCTFEELEKSSTVEPPEMTAARLRMLRERFSDYMAGGPTPANWWGDVVATTRPSAATSHPTN